MRQRPEVCGPAADDVMPGLVAEAKHLVSGPKLQKARNDLHVPALDSALVHAVQSDSLCSLAAQTINRARGGIDSSRTIYLVKAGSVYWAEDRSIRAGEYIVTFILDSSLTAILSKPFR